MKIKLSNKTQPASPSAPATAPTATPAPARSRAEELVDRALGIGLNSYQGIARQPGIAISAHGLLEHVQLTETQALRYVCATLLNHQRHVMQASFNAFDSSPREIAHALLIAESFCFKAGEDFVVSEVNASREAWTEAQLFGLLCDSVDSWAEFEECLSLLARRQNAAYSAKRQQEADDRVAAAERALQSALDARPGNPQVAA